ncbi:LacI family DNA-binding transcriptional regulator [Paenibacillus filicis]|uniref:LacI family DNA-binding transcriptional regulator n=1 Tax=Paenibacillus filicis TaxID=669464 RepID=A0ABU9DG16_9BACL
MGTKRVTSFDVAKLAGVSRSVVSAVLNGTQGIGVSSETREAVLSAIRELNYHVDAQARGMKTGKSFSIAAFGDTGNPLFLQMLEGMQRACGESGYHLLISGQGTREEGRFKLIDLFLQRRIDGIVSLDEVSYADPQWEEAVRQSGVPFVSVEGYAETPSVVSVLTDYGQSIRDALELLAAADGRDRAPVYMQLVLGRSAENWAERSRRQAYLDWCAERQQEPCIGTFDIEDREAVETLLGTLREADSIPPILCNWSIGAIAVYRYAYRHGLRIGSDLRVMAADDTLRSNRHMVPALSAMEIPYARMGEAAVQALLEQINGSGEAVEQEPKQKQAGESGTSSGQEPGLGFVRTVAGKRWLRASYQPGESI